MASSRPLGNWSDQTTMAEVLRWTMSLLPGSSGVVDNGCAWTSGVSGPHRPEYFSGARTLIVGLDNGLVPPGHATTKVHWDVPLALTAAPHGGRIFLVIGCTRHFGGLHSRSYDAAASIYVNDQSVEGINLRLRPDTHSDYFHRAPLPNGFPVEGPLVECSTLYAWLVPQSVLNPHRREQCISIALDDNVVWDIDYVGFVHEAPHRIFISYSRHDRRVAQALRHRLSSAGITVWIDTQEIRIGDSLIKKIQGAIDGVEYVFALLSDNSINSSWVQKELEVAITQEINGRITKVVPILLDNCKIPSFLASKAYADLRPPRNYERVMRQVSELLHA
jgi:hypothetical protein